MKEKTQKLVEIGKRVQRTNRPTPAQFDKAPDRASSAIGMRNGKVFSSHSEPEGPAKQRELRNNSMQQARSVLQYGAAKKRKELGADQSRCINEESLELASN